MTPVANPDRPRPRVLALSGGVGGAKLALGLYRVLDPWELAVVANTGDDFQHLGLHIAPDIDTVMYTLAGESHPERGWGRAAETWTFMAQLARLGGETWFNLGDGDLAVHMRRAELLRRGETLSAVTAELCRRLGVRAHVWPMSDAPVRTVVSTADGRKLGFQNYFVRERCEPRVRGFHYEGADGALPNPSLLALLEDPALRAVVICPSNPFVSVDPILALPGLRDALKACPAPVVAVSPIVGGRAVKGPLAKMLGELELPVSALGVAQYYADLPSGFVLDHADADEAGRLGIPALVTATVMRTLDDREALARAVLDFAGRLAAQGSKRVAGPGE